MKSYGAGHKGMTWYKFLQVLILIFAMCLMLSKHYELFSDIFSFFYETEFSIVCFAVGAFSILHSFYMLYKAFTTKEVHI